MRKHCLSLILLFLLGACSGTTVEVATPVATTSPVPTPRLTSATPRPITGSILVAYGANDRLALAQVDSKGTIRLLTESRSMLAPLHLSPDGNWLSYYDSDNDQPKPMLYSFQTHEAQPISVPSGAIATVPIFDTASQRVVYTVVSNIQVGNTYAWNIYVRDIATGLEAIFEGPVVKPGQQYAEPLPGAPIAWLNNEVLVDTAAPYSESSNLGVWALAVSHAAPGETVALRQYDRLVLSSQDVEYMEPTLSPEGVMLAFIVWDYDHRPSCLDDPFGSATGLGVVPVAGGSARLLVDVMGTDSVLADQPLAWSPDGSQILFAQGVCQDTSSRFEPALRTVDLQGNIGHEWSLARLTDTCCQEALWCTPEQIFYLHGENQLWRLNVETGQSEQVLSSEQIQLVGCLPW